MSTFDELPVGAVLPPLNDAAQAALQSVQDSGTTLTLACVDEAELAAVGLGHAQRQGRQAITEPELNAAATRLLERGLAEPQPWAAGRVRPAGGLLLYAQLTLNPRAHAGLTQSWTKPEEPHSQRQRRRVSVLVDVAPAGQACVETSFVPAVDAPASVPVTLELVRLDVLVDQVSSAAFSDPAGTSVRETVVAFADGSGTLVPSRLRVDATGHGKLESTRHGLLGNRTTRHAVDQDAFADHLRERLMAAG